MNTYSVSDVFLKKYTQENSVAFSKLLDSWALNNSDFVDVLDRWFNNFSENEKPTALKVLHNIDYYSESRFENIMKQRRDRLTQILHSEDLGLLESCFFLVPSSRGDSSDAHSYKLTKLWKVSPDKIIRLDQFSSIDFGDSPIVIFNDTHGSGNQFMRDWRPSINNRLNSNPFFMVAIVIAPEAYKLFQKEIPKIKLIPDSATSREPKCRRFYLR